jgi:hypothetical protein
MLRHCYNRLQKYSIELWIRRISEWPDNLIVMPDYDAEISLSAFKKTQILDWTVFTDNENNLLRCPHRGPTERQAQSQ